MAQGNQLQKRNLASEAFRKNYAALNNALAVPDVASGLAIKLYGGAIITVETRDAVQVTGITPRRQASLLLQAVESSIEIDYTRLRKFTRVLRKKPVLERIAKQLRQCYNKLVSEARLTESSSSESDTDYTQQHQYKGQGFPKNGGSGSEPLPAPVTPTGIPGEQEAEDSGEAYTRTQSWIKELEGKYRDLVKKTQKEVMKQKPDLDDFRAEITLLPTLTSVREEHQQYIKDNLPQLYDAKSIPAIFGLLNLYWNYLHYSLLQHIIEMYGSDDTKDVMKSYIKDVNSFQQETTLAMFWGASPKRMSDAAYSVKEKLTEVLTSHKELTSSSLLKFIDEFRQKFALNISLPECAVVMKDILPGSVMIVWLMPAKGAITLKNQVEQGIVEFFKQHHILQLRMDDVIIYSESQPSSSKRALVPKKKTTHPKPSPYFTPEPLFGFEAYMLNGVQVTEEEFGRGSYAAVMRLEYRGLKCAGKKLHLVLYERGMGDTVRRFKDECQLLAQMRHPNIVQFIGVYFEEGSPVPILVMEFLPTTLAKCIEAYGVLPKEVSYSILHDVALGLYHFHSQTPPIVHRDLSANNVLLTPNMTAKISDLGVARILNLTPQQMSRMTRTPGTPAYMPPEAMEANPRYDARIDEFSYGILMIHVFSGRWPLPLRAPVCVDPENRDQLLPVSEAQRRDEYLRDIGNDHPLMELILRCVSNDPKQRATAAQIVQRMEHMTCHSPPAFPNRIEMLKKIRADATEKESLREELETFAAEYEQNRLEREELIQQHEVEVEKVRTEVKVQVNAQTTAARSQLRGEFHRLEQLAQQRQEEIACSEMAHTIEITETHVQLQEAFQTELWTRTETHQAEMRAQSETHRAEINEAREQERRRLTMQLDSLRTEVTRMRSATESLQTTVASKNEIIQSNATEISSKEVALASKDAELAAKKTILERQSSTIREQNEQLTRAREFLSGHKQAKITWEPCSDLPVKMHGAQTVVIKDKVYCGGGIAHDASDKLRVFCYSPAIDTWDALPSCDMCYFGLSHRRGKLVTVGGMNESEGTVTNEVNEFDEATHSWKQSIRPMPTARHSPTILSHHSALIVAGGFRIDVTVGRTSVVEVFTEETSQWHTNEPLPVRWITPSSLLISNRWYLLGGGAEEEIYSNRTVCTHVDLLLQKSLPCDQASTEFQGDSTAWEVLPNTPFYGPAAATFGASLLAVGGTTTNEKLKGVSAVDVYFPCTNEWIRISAQPVPRVGTTTAMLSPTELLVIGGWDSGSGSQNSVYKGLLRIE